MRVEKDSMGAMEVPDGALYGACTQRAVLNFPVSGHRLPRLFIRALGMLKGAAARANASLGRLEAEKGALVEAAARRLVSGELDEHFVVDVFQTGSGTSTNMNANEVIGNVCSELAGEPLGSKRPVHPNDDVNLGQSSNDVIPSALHVSAALALRERLLPALGALREAVEGKAKDFEPIVKIGRTHLMDAVPLSLGQSFGGWAQQLRKAEARAQKGIALMGELALGGTAVGTGINGHPEFSAAVCASLSKETGITFTEAADHFEAQGAREDCMELGGLLVAIAGTLSKIANDVRWLASGPRAGLGELQLPAVQPGSSIMPGKVNPVMSEMLLQAAAYATAMGGLVQTCSANGQLELNVNLPLIAYALHEAIHTLAQSSSLFAERCIAGLSANAENCKRLVERSLMLVTALNPLIGYDAAAAVAKEAFETNASLKEVLLKRKLLPEAEIDKALNPERMLRPEA